MIDKEDYFEPTCVVCDLNQMKQSKLDAPKGQIPVGRIIEKVDRLVDDREYDRAGSLLRYWLNEANVLNDKRGALSMQSELVGFYRKQNDKENALISVQGALKLVDELEQGDVASGATIFINCATAYKAFGMSKEAIPLYERAKSVYQKVLSESDAKFGGLYNNMALALVDENRFDEAEKAYLSALKVMQKVDGGQLECAITYINMAHMFESMKNKEKIDECMQKAYELLTSESLIKNGYYSFVLEKCAPSFGYFGDEQKYKYLKEQAEKIYEWH